MARKGGWWHAGGADLLRWPHSVLAPPLNEGAKSESWAIAFQNFSLVERLCKFFLLLSQAMEAVDRAVARELAAAAVLDAAQVRASLIRQREAEERATLLEAQLRSALGAPAVPVCASAPPS